MTHPTERYIAERAQELKVFHLGLMLSIPSFFDPGLPSALWVPETLHRSRDLLILVE